MDVKGVNNLDSNYPAKTPQVDSSKSTEQKAKGLEAEPKTSKVKQPDYEVSNSRVKQLMLEMKNVEREVSRDQYYLEQLSQAHKQLVSQKTIPQIYIEMIKIRNQARFEKEPIMSAIIPEKESFYRNYDDIKTLQSKVSSEMNRVQTGIQQAKQQVNKFAISLENIKASVSEGHIRELQHLFNKEMLYKNFNKDVVVSLMS
ncbi:MAG: hypothetical protein KKH98_04515 [Spirochaetes bacterium]|nr:hypothetical protein [Spirochaetota bacterium]